jgi:hypothetical protein
MQDRESNDHFALERLKRTSASRVRNATTLTLELLRLEVLRVSLLQLTRRGFQ